MIIKKYSGEYLLVIISILIVSCSTSNNTEKHYTYPKSIAVSDSLGVPSSEQTFYYPFIEKIDNKIIKTGIDSLKNNLYSTILYTVKEPILYNYYLNQDQVRLLIMEAWGPVKVIDVKRNNSKIMIEIKKANVNTSVFFSIMLSKQEQLDAKKQFVEYKKFKNEIENNWEEFSDKINQLNFMEMKSVHEIDVTDGTSVILEGHTKNKYWFVKRWEPGQKWASENVKEDSLFKETCDYIAKLAGEKIKW